VAPALVEVCDVFCFDARFVTLFYEAGAASRFVRQRILLNAEPIYARLEQNPVDDGEGSCTGPAFNSGDRGELGRKRVGGGH
jgi:hypothetical protein